MMTMILYLCNSSRRRLSMFVSMYIAIIVISSSCTNHNINNNNKNKNPHNTDSYYYYYYYNYNSYVCYGEKFNDQLMPRITERLDDFFGTPVSLVQRTVTRLELSNDITNEISIPDFMKDMYADAVTNEKSTGFPLPMVVALENGIYISFSYYDDVSSFSYREPGNSGYTINTTTMVDNTDPNYKYWISCFNNTNGIQQNCTMEIGDQYIECINDCELISCPSTATTTETTNETNETTITNSSSSSNNNNNNNTNTTTETILCRNYQIKEVKNIDDDNNNNNNTNPLGFVPLFDMCLNTKGELEQRPGYVLRTFQTKEVGNCYYEDQTTVVNQTLFGDYAICGINDTTTTATTTTTTTKTKTNNNNNKYEYCNDGLTGAFWHLQYDPRYRPFYTSMKNELKPKWSEPFFYLGAFYLSIGYEHPLFSTVVVDDSDNDNDNKNKNNSKKTYAKVYEGVLSADYELIKITSFLRQEYYNTDIQVVVVEKNEPHYIIATSYHEQQYQLKAVLLSDITKPCPDIRLQQYINNSTTSLEIDFELCDVVRIPISDMNIVDNTSTNSSSSSTNSSTGTTMDPLDIVSYRAFIAHQKEGFPSNSIVHVKRSDAIGSKAYASQGKIYQLPQSNTTQWHVLAILPMERSTNDASVPGDASFAAICFIGCLGFFGCLFLFFQFYNRRKERAMVQADWRFTCAFILGCTFLNLSTFTLLGENTDPTCMLRMWSFNGFFACALSPLFVKVWRMYNLLNASSSFKRTSMSNFTAFLYTLPLIAIQLLLLMIFSIVDPPRQTERLGVGDGIGVQQITCEQKTNAFLITQVVFDGFLIFVGCVLAYRTRDLDPKFGEAKQLGFSMYNIAFTGIVTIATANMIDLDQSSKMILQAVGVFWASFFCSFSFVLPRLLEVAKQRGGSSDASRYGQSYISGLESEASRLNASVIRRPSNSRRESDTETNFELSGLGIIFENLESGDDSESSPSKMSRSTCTGKQSKETSLPGMQNDDVSAGAKDIAKFPTENMQDIAKVPTENMPLPPEQSNCSIIEQMSEDPSNAKIVSSPVDNTVLLEQVSTEQKGINDEKNIVDNPTSNALLTNKMSPSIVEDPTTSKLQYTAMVSEFIDFQTSHSGINAEEE